MSDAPAKQIPWAPIVGGLALLAGTGLVVGAVFLLSGLGWAMLVAAVPLLGLAGVIFRGLLHG